MALTRTELDNLKRIASQAGFSKWTYVTADSEFYHAFCPPTALALIARIEALETALDAAEETIHSEFCGGSGHHPVHAEVIDLRAALDKGDA